MSSSKSFAFFIFKLSFFSKSENTCLYSLGNNLCRGKLFATLASAATAPLCCASSLETQTSSQKTTTSLSGLYLSGITTLHVHPVPSGVSVKVYFGFFTSLFFEMYSLKIVFGSFVVLRKTVAWGWPFHSQEGVASAAFSFFFSDALDEGFCDDEASGDLSVSLGFGGGAAFAATAASATSAAWCFATCCFKRSICLNNRSQCGHGSSFGFSDFGSTVLPIPAAPLATMPRFAFAASFLLKFSADF